MGLFNRPEKELRVKKELDYSGQNLTQVPKEFKHCEQLVSLNCSKNKLSSLPTELEALQNLQSIDISQNVFTTFPLELPTTLTAINASNNRLFMSVIPEEIGKFGKVEKLDLSFNQLEKLPLTFQSLNSLKELNLQNNLIIDVPEVLFTFPFLLNLNLSNNKIKVLSPDIGRLTTLVSLNVGGNLLGRLPDMIGNLVNLCSLDVSNNALKTLPDTISRLVVLKELILEDNKELHTLPQTLSKLNCLTKVNIRSTKLDTIPYSLREAPLTELSLRGSLLIKEIPDYIGQFTKLIKIDLQRCGLCTISESLGELEHLEYLDLRENMLTDTSLPFSLDTLNRLMRLQISGNKFTRLPSQVYALKGLKDLDISDNEITIFSDALGGSTIHESGFMIRIDNTGKIAHYLDNKISTFPPSIGRLKKLCVLEARGNLLHTICPEISECSELMRIDFRNINIFDHGSGRQYVTIILYVSELDPFDSPPQNIIVRGTACILHYLKMEAFDIGGIELTKSDKKKLEKEGKKAAGHNSNLLYKQN